LEGPCADGEFCYGKIVGSVKRHFGINIIVQTLDDGYDGYDGENTDDDSQ